MGGVIRRHEVFQYAMVIKMVRGSEGSVRGSEGSVRGGEGSVRDSEGV